VGRRSDRRWLISTAATGAVVGAVLVALLGSAASASFSSTGSGAAAGRSGTLPAPPPPGAHGILNIGGLVCTVTVTWSAPPPSTEYTIVRTNSGTVVAGPTTAGGSAIDVVTLASIVGKPRYDIEARWSVGHLWMATSPTVVATGC
jgi:hypothetical protein